MILALPLLLLPVPSLSPATPLGPGADEDHIEHLDASLVVGEAGEELPFQLDLEETGGVWRAYLINDPERIEIPEVAFDGTHLRLGLPHYRSRLLAQRDPESGAFEGTWTKVRGADRIARVPFQAHTHVPEPARRELAVLPKSVAGRWAAAFESDSNPAVGIFAQDTGRKTVHGTFLTATGDYRYLVGAIDGNDLELSCFDGAHAFLFRAAIQEDGSLAGTFWSGNWWHESWTAQRDPAAEVVDAFAQTRWNPELSLADLAFPDPEGQLLSLADPRLDGRARLLVLFGTWCPNCNDEAPYLAELYRTYHERGLSIVGLAFELTGNVEEDSLQVRRFRDRYRIPFPLLLAGTADKAAATEAFAALDRVRSFPTTVFLHGDGSVLGVHSGYAGPATGKAHQKLREDFESRIEQLLAEPEVETSRAEANLWAELLRTPWEWYDGYGRTVVRFEDASTGPEAATVIDTPFEVTGMGSSPVSLFGNAVWIGISLWKFDEQAGVLLDPRDVSRRLSPKGDPTPLLTQRGISSPEDRAAALRDTNPTLRREALIAATTDSSISPPESLRITARALTLLDDPNLAVRSTAAWTLGHSDDEHAATALLERLGEPNASFRREVVRSLLRIAKRSRDGEPAWMAKLAPLTESDPDPLIRKALRWK